ncbi:hypothetical protein [Pedobacter sp. ASV28]|uniref:hypothetical protein n=1 Tax=Pedobacter sp. ASV28 TaxID=2795123 RepID=UPI0018EAC50D|nr:hypothetical protein [Pedobacter sp. ASV28]
MKKLFYSLALVVLGFTASYAQQAGKIKATPEQRAERVALAMQQKLSLTDQQKIKVQQLELDRIKQQNEWRKQDQGATNGKTEERKAAFKAHKEKLDAILTPEQQKVFAASKEEMRGKLKEKRGKGRKGPKREKDPASKTQEN